jgi:hypothetical protein
MHSTWQHMHDPEQQQQQQLLENDVWREWIAAFVRI